MTLFIFLITFIIIIIMQQPNCSFYSYKKYIIHQLSILRLNLQGPEKTLVLKSCFIIKN